MVVKLQCHQNQLGVSLRQDRSAQFLELSRFLRVGQEFAFLTSSQMIMVLVQEPHFENCCCSLLFCFLLEWSTCKETRHHPTSCGINCGTVFVHIGAKLKFRVEYPDLKQYFCPLYVLSKCFWKEQKHKWSVNCKMCNFWRLLFCSVQKLVVCSAFSLLDHLALDLLYLFHFS